ncbi:MAG: leucine-rich repeat domain-containing protein, partial [Pseudomonadota bacterium]
KRQVLITRLFCLCNTQIIDILPLQYLTGLHVLLLNDTQITELAPLRGLTRLETLHLGSTQITDLAPLKGLTGLKALYLTNTTITNLESLQGLAELQELSLEKTEIEDLRPLLALPSLWSALARGWSFLSFERTGATRNDPVLAELAELEDQAELGRRLREHLESLPPWPEPLPSTSPPAEPQQKSSLDFIWTANGFALNSRPVSVDDDPVAVATRDDLVELMNELCRQSGNHHDDVFRRGDTLRQRLEEPELDLLRIHLAFQRLQRVYDQRGNRDDPLQPEVAATLQDVVETLPGLTLGDERVRNLLERQARNRTDRVEVAQVEAEIGVLQAVTADDAPFDTDAKELAEDASVPEVDDQLTRSRPTLAWNAIVAVGQEFKNAPAATSIAVATVLTPAVQLSAPWVVAHADEILIAARLWGAEFFGWINPIISQARAITEAMHQR